MRALLADNIDLPIDELQKLLDVAREQGHTHLKLVQAPNSGPVPKNMLIESVEAHVEEDMMLFFAPAGSIIRTPDCERIRKMRIVKLIADLDRTQLERDEYIISLHNEGLVIKDLEKNLKNIGDASSLLSKEVSQKDETIVRMEYERSNLLEIIKESNESLSNCRIEVRRLKTIISNLEQKPKESILYEGGYIKYKVPISQFYSLERDGDSINIKTKVL